MSDNSNNSNNSNNSSNNNNNQQQQAQWPHRARSCRTLLKLNSGGTFLLNDFATTVAFGCRGYCSQDASRHCKDDDDDDDNDNDNNNNNSSKRSGNVSNSSLKEEEYKAQCIELFT